MVAAVGEIGEMNPSCGTTLPGIQELLERPVRRSRDAADDTRQAEGLIKKLAGSICNRARFAQDGGGRLHIFSDGVYAEKGKDYVLRNVKHLLVRWKKSELWKPSLADAVVEFIRIDSPELWQRPPQGTLNVKNGLLDVASCKLKPHDPSHLSTVQLPVTYDPTARCTEIEKFVSEVFPFDAVNLAWEIPALLMLPNTSFQKAVLLLGAGGNGKSRYLEMLRAFLGKGNTSTKSLHKLESDRFSVSQLYGKLANICPDLPTEHLAGTSVFKQLTGGDMLSGERKFQESFDFTPFARLVFSANTPPKSQDSSQGFFDRWIVLPFDRSFRGDSDEIPSHVLDARLSSPEELSGLLNKALEVLPQLQQRNAFTAASSAQQAGKEFRAVTDPLAVWLDKSTIEDPAEFVVKEDMRIAFNAHLEKLGRITKTDKAFGVEFERLRPSIESKQRTVDGRTKWCYVGIKLRPGYSHGSQDSQD